jgi:DNA-binding CsgD family transcriptional regulator
VDKHLIFRAEALNDEPRFGVLETIREFGLELLASSGEETATRNAHASYFSSLVETSEVQIYNLGRPADLARIEADHANVRATLSWLIATEQGREARRLSGALFWFWFYRSYLTEGRTWLAHALALPADEDEPPAIQAGVLAGAGALAIFQQDLAAAEASLAAALDILRTEDDRRLLAMVHVLSALLALFQDRFDDVTRHAALATEYAEPIGDLGSRFRATFFAALAARGSGDAARAAALLEDLLVQTRQAGATYFQALALQCSSPLLTGKDETHLAARRYEEALRIFRDAGELWSVAACLVGIAAVGASRDAGAAARLLGAAAELRAAVAAPIAPTDRLILEQATSTVKALLGDSSFNKAWAAGGQLSLVAALEVASGIVESCAGTGSDTERSNKLTPRELEVLRLVAAGRTDREIADALFISINTAMKHVGNILMKLEVESRTAAAAFAHRDGIA